MDAKGIFASLDELSVRHLELLNQHLLLSQQLEGSMRDGWLHLSKTRYVMGYGLSCVAQHDERERKASFSVATVKSELEPWPHFSCQEDSSEEDEVRRRFGVLSPQSAKQCKASFQRSLHLAVELATVRAELVSNQKKYKELITRKQVD